MSFVPNNKNNKQKRHSICSS